MMRVAVESRALDAAGMSLSNLASAFDGDVVAAAVDVLQAPAQLQPLRQ
jgi:hypothetical protein